MKANTKAATAMTIMTRLKGFLASPQKFDNDIFGHQPVRDYRAASTDIHRIPGPLDVIFRALRNRRNPIRS